MPFLYPIFDKISKNYIGSHVFNESTFPILFNEFEQVQREYPIVIFKSFNDAPGGFKEEIEEIEEQNWTLLNETKAKGFREKLDAFFEDYPQEDLLAFVEDALVEDEDDFLTKEGKELIS